MIMSTYFTGIVSTIGLAIVGLASWIWNLGDRVTKLETRREDLSELLDTKFEGVNSRLDRIETSMSHLLNKE